jgi:hypothetical protein
MPTTIFISLRYNLFSSIAPNLDSVAAKRAWIKSVEEKMLLLMLIFHVIEIRAKREDEVEREKEREK